jgi:hypothetical protein
MATTRYAAEDVQLGETFIRRSLPPSGQPRGLPLHYRRGASQRRCGRPRQR